MPQTLTTTKLLPESIAALRRIAMATGELQYRAVARLFAAEEARLATRTARSSLAAGQQEVLP